MRRLISFSLLLLLIISSCVTPKVHNALIAENEVNQRSIIEKDKQLLKLSDEIEVLNNDIQLLKKRIESLSKDSTQNKQAISSLRNKYEELESAYDLLTSKNSRYIAEKAKETKKLLGELELVENELFNKEDELNKLSLSLTNRENEITTVQKELEARSKRVMELETIINQKDSMLSSLRKRISKALIGLEGEGLTIEQKNGKVYISLEEKLLFASGKYKINASGISALKKLAYALSLQKDIDILVEGHTDSIPYTKGTLKDNWDLSVMRSTSVVKALLSGSTLHPNRLTAAGRGEFIPEQSNKTKEGRSKNRRIEIILSPNLDDLFNILQE